ncbi:hypothetical protein EXIGLDRAFT_834324 [Exidia glandulosa HHB12029]|uniref:Uncharacterized protein n=1 Tax=Exidia glandulosa HHB12029 TaxID=1314781 RepID=A0A165JY76_EXIGL|nr:hypothetical protein EXIGLDRAFT_834324 [Exidia glandulosa HHB12029]
MASHNVLWNLTVPDTSLAIDYSDFNRDCPINNGVLQCTSGSAHVSNSTSSSLTIRFFGTAIYLFGNVDGGTQYTLQLDDKPATQTQPQPGNLLGSFTNLPNKPNDADDDLLHSLTLSATRFKEGSILRFNGAIISVDTGSPSAKVSVTKYTLTDQNANVVLTPGWAKNASYIQSGTAFAQHATVNFEGVGVMVYGLCSNTRQDFGNDYGEVSTDVDSFAPFVSDSSDGNLFETRPYIADDCLMYFSTSLSQGAHNLTYNSNLDNVFLKRFEVVSVDGAGGGSIEGTNNGGGVSVGGGLPGSNSGTGDSGSDVSAGNNGPNAAEGVAKALGLSIGAIIGIAFAVVGVLIFVGIAVCVTRRRRKARLYANMSSTSLQPITQKYSNAATPMDSQVALQPTFAPPPGPPPHLTRVPQPSSASNYAPPPGPPPSAQHASAPVRATSMVSRSSAWSSHGSQATTDRSSSTRRPQPYAIATSVPTESSGPSPSTIHARSPQDSVEDPYAGMASYHPDPFAFAGRGVVLSADGVHTYDDPAVPPKLHQERMAAPVHRTGESSGSSSSGPGRHSTMGGGGDDAPPPIYEETPGESRI